MHDNDQQIVKEVLQSLLSYMDITAEIEVVDAAGTAVFNLKTDDSSILIGQHGGNLAALQYLTRVLSHKKLAEPAAFVIDVEGYKKHREEYLRELARQAAARVRQTGERLLLKPMLSYERRVVHAELNSLPDITTESVGEDPERRVLIKPKPEVGSREQEPEQN